jgi:tripartite-type tricarboxylate transporter receptor subunit TctC
MNMEFAHDEPVRQQIELLIVTQDMDRPVRLPPGVPVERVAELRAAFDATMADEGFRADAERMHLHLDPVRGEDIARALARAYALPNDVVAAAREVMGDK